MTATTALTTGYVTVRFLRQGETIEVDGERYVVTDAVPTWNNQSTTTVFAKDRDGAVQVLPFPNSTMVCVVDVEEEFRALLDALTGRPA